MKGHNTHFVWRLFCPFLTTVGSTKSPFSPVCCFSSTASTFFGLPLCYDRDFYLNFLSQIQWLRKGPQMRTTWSSCFLKEFWWIIRHKVLKGSKIGPHSHLVLILLLRSLFSHWKYFDFPSSKQDSVFATTANGSTHQMTQRTPICSVCMLHYYMR